MTRIRVLVVEDSLTVRKHLVEVLGSHPDLEVVGEAGDGKLAIELCAALRPDVISLDMMLPVMSGLAVTEYVMAHFPTPILVVSASTNRGELFRTYEALAAGAVEVMEKPTGQEPEGEWERRFIDNLKLVSRIRVITHPRARLIGMTQRYAMTHDVSHARQRLRAVGVGASTGGPGALVSVLGAIPNDYPVPILVVMHIGDPFGSGFADWLDRQTEHRVRFAEQGEDLQDTGSVRLAPPGKHLALRAGHLVLTSDPERHSCRPSVDVLFESLAAELGADSAGCLLTGMGRDGAAGLLALRRAGASTIAEHESTAVVWGMPREAVELGAAERVLPLLEIGPAIAGLAPEKGEARR